NQPSRVFWIDQIGLPGTITSLLVLYGMAVAAAVLLGPLFMLVLAVGIFNSIFYSVRPLRFKARPLASLVSFSGAVGLSFLSGVPHPNLPCRPRNGTNLCNHLLPNAESEIFTRA